MRNKEPEMGFIERHVSEAFTLVEHPMAPGILGAPIHTHSREDELSYVVYGTVQAQVGEQVITAGPHDIIWKPRGVPHAFWNPGPEPALILELIVPGGFEGYFRELVALARASGGVPDRGRHERDSVAVWPRHGPIVDRRAGRALRSAPA